MGKKFKKADMPLLMKVAAVLVGLWFYLTMPKILVVAVVVGALMWRHRRQIAALREEMAAAVAEAAAAVAPAEDGSFRPRVVRD